MGTHTRAGTLFHSLLQGDSWEGVGCHGNITVEPGRLFLEVELFFFFIFGGKWISVSPSTGGEALSGGSKHKLRTKKPKGCTDWVGGDRETWWGCVPHFVLSLAFFSGKPGSAFICP